MPVTSPDSIYYADGSTAMSAEAISAAQATSVQDALDVRQIKSYVWANATARGTQTGMTEGDMGYQRDTNEPYLYTGTAWVVLQHPGLTRIIPASVTGSGMTLNPDGSVTGVGVNPGSVNGVFTSAFRNYKMLIRKLNSSTGWMRFRLRAAGADTTTGYDDQRITGNGTAVAAAAGVNTAEWTNFVTTPYPRAAIEMDLFSPSLAEPTFAMGRMFETNNTGALGLAQWGGDQRASTQYDGITFLTNAGTEAFVANFYGYN